MEWFKTEMAGTCFGCDCDSEEFYSIKSADAGPWVCGKCKQAIDRFLHFSGYILSTPIQVAPL